MFGNNGININTVLCGFLTSNVNLCKEIIFLNVITLMLLTFYHYCFNLKITLNVQILHVHLSFYCNVTSQQKLHQEHILLHFTYYLIRLLGKCSLLMFFLILNYLVNCGVLQDPLKPSVCSEGQTGGRQLTDWRHILEPGNNVLLWILLFSYLIR